MVSPSSKDLSTMIRYPTSNITRSLILLLSLVSASRGASVSVPSRVLTFDIDESFVGFCTRDGPSPVLCYSIDNMFYYLADPSGPDTISLHNVTISSKPSSQILPYLVIQTASTSNGARMSVSYIISDRDSIKFTISVSGDRVGYDGDPSRQIQSTLSFPGRIIANASSYSDDTKVGLRMLTEDGMTTDYSQPLVANFSDVPSTGVAFTWGVSGNSSASLGIAASWNSTWIYDPDVSVTLSYRKKDEGDGDDSAFLLTVVLPSVLIPAFVLASVVTIVAIVSTVFCIKYRSISRRDCVNF